VIPLENLSGDPGQEYLADGMTDELITQIAKNSMLRVTSRTSVMQYKGVHRPLPEIASALGVDGILEGSISRSGDKLHMTIQLIQASTDTHVWAESYDRDANDSVLLPRDAAITIAKKLSSSVPQPAPRYVSPAAHDAYLRGQALFFTQDTESGAYFKKAIELQPDYSLGWSGLAKYYGDGADGGSLRPQEAVARAKAAALKAVELDDSSAEAHLALGAAYWLDRSWPGALLETARAIELGPTDGETYQVRAMLLATLNRDQEAIEVEKKSLEVDPFARPYGLAMIYRVARQDDAAIADAKQRLEYAPNKADLYWQLAASYENKGMFEQEEEMVMKASALDGDTKNAARFHRIYLKGGHWAAVRQGLLDTEERASKQYVSPYELADLHAKLGHREEALTYLEAAYRERTPLLLWIQGYPEFDFLHKEERYRAIIRGMGLPPAY
jgi:TolB-like protein/Flp pilus assembly protein TadD